MNQIILKGRIRNDRPFFYLKMPCRLLINKNTGRIYHLSIFLRPIPYKTDRGKKA